jgi:hypothetical protein
MLLLREFPRYDKSTMGDSFPGDMCPSPVTRSHLSLGACRYATYHPHGPHLQMGHVFTQAFGARHFATPTIEKKLSQVSNPR